MPKQSLRWLFHRHLSGIPCVGALLLHKNHSFEQLFHSLTSLIARTLCGSKENRVNNRVESGKKGNKNAPTSEFSGCLPALNWNPLFSVRLSRSFQWLCVSLNLFIVNSHFFSPSDGSWWWIYSLSSLHSSNKGFFPRSRSLSLSWWTRRLILRHKLVTKLLIID